MPGRPTNLDNSAGCLNIFFSCLSYQVILMRGIRLAGKGVSATGKCTGIKHSGKKTWGVCVWGGGGGGGSWPTSASKALRRPDFLPILISICMAFSALHFVTMPEPCIFTPCALYFYHAKKCVIPKVIHLVIN